MLCTNDRRVSGMGRIVLHMISGSFHCNLPQISTAKHTTVTLLSDPPALSTRLHAPSPFPSRKTHHSRLSLRGDNRSSTWTSVPRFAVTKAGPSFSTPRPGGALRVDGDRVFLAASNVNGSSSFDVSDFQTTDQKLRHDTFRGNLNPLTNTRRIVYRLQKRSSCF